MERRRHKAIGESEFSRFPSPEGFEE